MKRSLMCAALALAAAATPAAAQAPAGPEPQWDVVLTRDLLAMRAAIDEGHPGPVDELNPSFKLALEEGLKRAMERAPTANSAGGWWWALREYAAIFDDGHLSVGMLEKAPPLTYRWPGFLTRFEGRDQIIAVRLEQAGLPELGAKLISCDGHSAWRLAEEHVGRFHGRWQLEAQRARQGARLFLDASNPWIKQPQSCVFEHDGRSVTYRLDWRDLSGDEAGQRLTEAQRSFRAPIERRALAGGGAWISAGSFDGNPASDAGKALRAVVEGMKADQAALRAAPVVVLDLRGNGGGSSAWSREMAVVLWGEDYVAAREPGSDYVDWRVAEANIATIRGFGEALRQDPQANPEWLKWVEEVVAGMEAARAAGRPLWRQGEGTDDAPSAGAAAAPQFAGRAYVLTDAACASACLDAVDLWKALGAVQVGGETSADTLYMEIREQPLPSEMAVLRLPMKVYRGRPRGLNEPHRPEHLWSGNMADTAGIEAWIAGLR